MEKSLIKKFDAQIKKESRYKGSIYNCESYYYKRIFMESFNFDINDWREVRKGDYWALKSSLKDELSILKFKLKRIMLYKNKINE